MPRAFHPATPARSVEELDPDPLRCDRIALMQHIRNLDREAIRTHYERQPVPGAEVLANYVVNLWEYEHGVETLTSRPWNVTIPMTEVCNAACTFCSAPLVPAPLALGVGEIRHFAEALRYATRVSLQGLGEPLAHPQFEAVAEEIRRHLNPVAELEMITNGWLLSGRRWELLKSIRIAHLQVSVNAATDSTHQAAMGSRPGTFDQVVKNIENVRDDPGWARRLLKVSMVITRHSLPEVVPFLDMFVDLGIEAFQFNALLPLTTADWGFGRKGQYVDLWCGHLPNAAALVDDALVAIEKYRRMGIVVTASPEQWLMPVALGLPLTVAGKPDVLMPHESQSELLQSDGPGARFQGTAIARRWAYLFRSSSFALTPGGYELQLDVGIAGGELYAGILDLEKNDFIQQRKLHAGSNTVDFAVPDARLVQVIVRQGDDDARVAATYRSGSFLAKADGAAIAPAQDLQGAVQAAAVEATVTADHASGGPAPSGRNRIYCPMVYNTLSVFHHSLEASVCCYMEHAPGRRRPSLKDRPLLDAYNDPGFRHVRRTLMSDAHLPVCETCPYGNFRA